MAVRISCKCFFVNLSIYQCFCCIHILFQIWILYSLFLYQINFPAKQGFQRIFEIKVIIEIVVYFRFVKRNYQVHIAVIIETVGKDRTEHKQLVYFMLLAQSDNLLYVVFYPFHKRLTCYAKIIKL